MVTSTLLTYCGAGLMQLNSTPAAAAAAAVGGASLEGNTNNTSGGASQVTPRGTPKPPASKERRTSRNSLNSAGSKSKFSFSDTDVLSAHEVKEDASVLLNMALPSPKMLTSSLSNLDSANLSNTLSSSLSSSLLSSSALGLPGMSVSSPFCGLSGGSEVLMRSTTPLEESEAASTLMSMFTPAAQAAKRARMANASLSKGTPKDVPEGEVLNMGVGSARRGSAASSAVKSVSKRDRSDSHFERAHLLANLSKAESAVTVAAPKAITTTTSTTVMTGKSERPGCLTPVLTDLPTVSIVKSASTDPLTDSSACSNAEAIAAATAAVEVANAGNAASAESAQQQQPTSLPFKKRRKTDGTSSTTGSNQDLTAVTTTAGAVAGAAGAAVTGTTVTTSTAAGTAAVGEVRLRDTDSEGRDSACSSRNSEMIVDQQVLDALAMIPTDSS
mmetsp:Transcript_111663/g.218883  ORF Transcript_111663/g.218883 Transcript_111663/m.218883 type:complete len:444 (-) Transcript_111663:57-1388(-)